MGVNSTNKLDLSLEEALKNKANKDWAETKMDSLKEDVDETKRIALGARKQADAPHSCLHEADFKSLIKSVSNWRNVRFGAFFTFLILCVGVLAQYYAFDSKVAHAVEVSDDNANKVDNVTQTVEKIAQSLESHIIWAEQKRVEAQDGEARTLRITVETIEHAIEKSMNKRSKRR